MLRIAHGASLALALALALALTLALTLTLSLSLPLPLPLPLPLQPSPQAVGPWAMRSIDFTGYFPRISCTRLSSALEYIRPTSDSRATY